MTAKTIDEPTSATTEDARADEALTPEPRAAVDVAMERYATGDESAFAELYDLIAPRLYGYLLRQTRDAAAAEDLLQQTMLQMHRARGRFIAGAEVTPWAFAIARRLLIDRARRRKRERVDDGAEPSGLDEVASPEADAVETLEAREVASRFQARLATLPEAQRVAFELIKQEGLSLAEAAQVLGTTVAAVKLRAHRAYSALKGVRRDPGDET